MKRIIGFSLLFGMLCLSSKALIVKNDVYPYHFIDENDEPFYLLSKSAYRLLDTRLSDTDRLNFMHNAVDEGFNSVRIWMIYPDWDTKEMRWNAGDNECQESNIDICNHFYAWPWTEEGVTGGNWYMNFSEAYWTKLHWVLDRLFEYDLPVLDGHRIGTDTGGDLAHTHRTEEVVIIVGLQ